MHITIGSVSRDGEISERTLAAADGAKHVVLQTDNFKNLLSVPYSSLDDIYESSEDFDELTEKACELLSVDGTLFICLGEPWQNNIALALTEKALNEGGTLDVLPCGNAALSLAMQEGMFKSAGSVLSATASGFKAVSDTDSVVVISEIDSRYAASELKLKLLMCYADEHEVLLVNLKDMSAQKFMLHELDSQEKYGYFLSAVIAPRQLEKKVRYTFSDLIAVMDRLRCRNGCPWDKEQTHESLKRYLVEESYEVLEAIDDGDMNALYDELGDVLLQVVFHAKIAQQSSEFDIYDVTTAICEKMINRHTHIFGDAQADTASDVVKNWEGIKKAEKNQRTQTEVLNGVPKSMPALMRSGKVQHKAAHVGFDFKQASEAMDKLKEEIREVEHDVAAGRDMTEECGDLLFSAVNVVRLLGIEPETTLQSATDKFIKRFEQVEKNAKERNIDMKTCSLDVLNELWDAAKQTLGSGD